MDFMLAQVPDPQSSARIGSVFDLLFKGGPVMIPIGICSIVALTVIVERLFSLRRRIVIPPTFLPGLQAIMKNRNGDDSKAVEYCRANSTPVGHIFAAAIRKLSEPIDRLEKLVQEAGEREVMKLRKGLRILYVIPSVSTMLGLLGTILGLINAFQTVATSGGEALGKTELLAGGIYEAMITTAAGLIVAIPVLVAYHWISARIDRLVRDIDTMTVDFVETYAVNGRSEAGPEAAEQSRPAVAASAEAA